MLETAKIYIQYTHKLEKPSDKDDVCDDTENTIMREKKPNCPYFSWENMQTASIYIFIFLDMYYAELH